MQASLRGPGRYRDTYEPDRQRLPLEQWPESDRRAAERARSQGDVLDLPGPAAELDEGTWRARTTAYGRYLTFLALSDELHPAEDVAERITPDRLARYVVRARQFLRASTLDQALHEFRLVAEAMMPERDWRWIKHVPGRPTRAEIRDSRKAIEVFDPRLLCCRALDFMDYLSEGPPRYEFRVLYRSALIVAFQCTFALRRKNLMCMRLGENLMIEDDRVWLQFRASGTKTEMPIQFGFSPFLKPYLGTWLDEHRPALLAGRDSAAVWINARHRPLGYGAAPFLFASMGELLIGRPITCHMFRHSVATAILTKDPRQMKIASGALTHRSVQVTHRHYDHSSDEGSRRVWEKARRDIIMGKGLAME